MDGFYLVCVFTVLSTCLGAYLEPRCANSPGGVIVQLFEWKWSDVALECERFLFHNGFCAVQVSLVTENAVIMSPARPWWERYEPVSYKLDNRSGNETQFADMVQRCNAVGIRVYVEVVLHNMATVNNTGVGTAGSSYASYDYPAVPFSSDHFITDCGATKTPTATCPLANDGQALATLRLQLPYVQDNIAALLNILVDYGVTGFFIRKADEMAPESIQDILDKVKDLPGGGRPFVYLDTSDSANLTSQYDTIGTSVDSNYSMSISNGLDNFARLANMITSTPLSDKVAYIDDEDKQRNHGSNSSVVSFETPLEFKLATAFMLASSDGPSRIMSSYYFGGNTDLGPPHHLDYSIKDVQVSPDGSCVGGWVCEHRWSPIANMVLFRNAVDGTDMKNVYASKDTIGFARGDIGFFVMTKNGSLDTFIQTGLPAGLYCDVVTNCSRTVLVDQDGTAHVVIKDTEEPILAFVVDNVAVTSTGSSIPTPTASNSSWSRTVVFIELPSVVGQYVFIRGGLDIGRHPECSTDPSLCEIPIEDRDVGTGPHYTEYNAWKVNDHVLSWGGAEPYQGRFQGQLAQGTPAVWTTNSVGQSGYNVLNEFGPHYWMVDINMDCSRTAGGWFELKAITNNGQWEHDVTGGACNGGMSPPYQSQNHLAYCGMINVFHVNRGDCEIKAFP